MLLPTVIMWDCFILEWCKNYGSRYPNPQKLQKEVDFFMENFDKEREKVQYVCPKTNSITVCLAQAAQSAHT